MLRSWKDSCGPIFYSGTNLFSFLLEINTLKSWKDFFWHFLFSVLEKIYFFPIGKIFVFKSKMRQKRMIFNQYFSSISKYLGQRRCKIKSHPDYNIVWPQGVSKECLKMTVWGSPIWILHENHQNWLFCFANFSRKIGSTEILEYTKQLSRRCYYLKYLFRPNTTTFW